MPFRDFVLWIRLDLEAWQKKCKKCLFWREKKASAGSPCRLHKVLLGGPYAWSDLMIPVCVLSLRGTHKDGLFVLLTACEIGFANVKENLGFWALNDCNTFHSLQSKPRSPFGPGKAQLLAGQSYWWTSLSTISVGPDVPLHQPCSLVDGLANSRRDSRTICNWV